jgi:hypothetical protein
MVLAPQAYLRWTEWREFPKVTSNRWAELQELSPSHLLLVGGMALAPRAYLRWAEWRELPLGHLLLVGGIAGASL